MPDDFLSAIQAGYTFEAGVIQLGAGMHGGEVLPEARISLPLRTLNRHGLISGATGTGKTKTLSVIAEQLSEAGVPVLLMDIKGDISGLAAPGEQNERISERHQKLGMEWSPSAYPVEFLTLSQEPGARLRGTVTEFGPILFSRILGLNDTQASLVALVFKFCDDKKLPLLDLRDFKKVLEYLTGPAKRQVAAEYGLISTTSVGLILRKLIELEQQGAELFFGEPSFEILDLLREDGGFGIISILRLTDLQSRPKLFSSFMLQMLGELFASLPEAGDLEKPKLVIFLDEAHLIFDEATRELVDQLETVVKLIRSKGVGLIFCTQTPTDIPEGILGQLGLKIQHALRAFTAKDRKAIKLVAENYPETPFYDVDQLLTQLGIGEALVTVLNESGTPSPLVHTLLAAPRSRMGPLEQTEIIGITSKSALVEKYQAAVDPRSAYEILGGKLAYAATASGSSPAAARRSWSPASGPGEAAPPPSPAPTTGEVPYPEPPIEVPRQPNAFEQVFQSSVGRAVVRSVAVAVAGGVTRSLLGTLGLGGRRARR